MKLISYPDIVTSDHPDKDYLISAIDSFNEVGSG